MRIRHCPVCRMAPRLQERAADGAPGYRYICEGCFDRAEGWSPTRREAAAAWNRSITAGGGRP